MSTTPTKQPVIPTIKRETILRLLKRGERIDGRKFEDYRNIWIAVNPIPKAEGSALVKLGNTTVVTGIKLEIGAPYSDRPYEGVLQVHAEFVPLASPTFEPGPPDEDAIEVARVIDRSLREPHAIRLEDLVIIPTKKVWILFNDLYLLDHDGNILDAGMLSSMLALNFTKIPSVVVEAEDNIIINREQKEKPLPLNLNVVTITIGVFEENLLVDPSLDEELIIDSRITFAVDENGRIVGLQKTGMKGIKQETFEAALDLALRKAKELHELIGKVLNNPQNYTKPSLALEELWG
ncbi:MAG: exosome complex component Rrp42 [Thermoprotei archaeon]|nr:MAG: exosome complex component Rrp42 [Thermoprotei archaeon]